VLKVNPEMLTELGNTLTTVVEALKARKPDASGHGPVINLAGLDAARACCEIPADHTMHLDSFAQHISAMASSARGGAENFRRHELASDAGLQRIRNSAR